MTSARNMTTAALAAALMSVTAAGTQAMTDGDPEFVPLVAPCVDAPGSDTCAEVRAVIAECADDLDYAACEMLFTDPDAVFDDPDLKDRAHDALRQTRDAMPDFPPVEGSDLSPEALDAARATAERALLRGDANQMTHSQPELLEGDLDEDAREATDTD